MRLYSRTEAVPWLDAGPPAPHEDLLHTAPSLAYFAGLECVKAWHESWVLDHEGHELGRVSPNTEELEPILLDKGLKCRVGGYANAVAVGFLEHFAKRNERLDVAARPDNLNDNVEPRWGCLAGFTA